jgi:hypothetical protein
MAKPAIAIPSLTQVEIGLTKLAALAGVVESYANEGHLPPAARAVLLAVSGVVIAVNHWFNRTTTAVPVTDTTAPPA